MATIAHSTVQFHCLPDMSRPSRQAKTIALKALNEEEIPKCLPRISIGRGLIALKAAKERARGRDVNAARSSPPPSLGDQRDNWADYDEETDSFVSAVT